MVSFWRRHRSTALRSLLLVALLHRLHCLAFLAASSPVWLLTAFLLGAVLVHSDPNDNAAAEEEEEDWHLDSSSASSSPAPSSDDVGSSSSSSVTSSMDREEEHHHPVVGVGDMAWTADDEHSIRSIGSLELERDARLEKLMSRRSIYRSLIDVDVIPPAVLAPCRTKNPFDLHHHHYDDTGSAPSSLLGAAHRTNPFDIHIHQGQGAPAMLLRRHETFTASGSSSDAPPARTSRFRPYFVADDVQGQEGAVGDAGATTSTSNSSSPSSSAASDHQTQQHHAVGVRVEEASARASTPGKWDRGMLEAVDVELISDSSDDDMSLPGDATAAAVSLHSNSNQLDEDEEDSFEVESITQQVAAVKQQPRVTAVEPVSSPPGQQQHVEEDASSKEWVAPTTVAPMEENEKMEREHHILGPVPIINSSTATSSGAGVGAARAVAAPSPAAAAPAPTPPAAASARPAPPAAVSAPQAAAPAPPAAASAPAASRAAASAPQAAAPAPAPAPAPAAAASAPPAATSRKPSSKSKAASKKPVFGFFRK